MPPGVLPGRRGGGASRPGRGGTPARLWWTEEVRELLARHRAALCWADRLGRPLAPLWRTADWGYLRLHEGGREGAETARPWPRYGEQALRSWVRRLAETWPDDADVFAYFNNDQGGAAVRDADAFSSMARRPGVRRWSPFGE